jgi:Tfp pilus assembly protein FimT
MSARSSNPQMGASVLEVLVVVSISVVLAGMAIAQFSRARTILSRQNIARTFKNSLERARFDSVKRRANDDSTMATVNVIDETTFSVTTDLNQNGVLDAAETQTLNFSRNSDVRLLLPPGNTAPVSISFDQRGHAIIEDYDGRNVEYFLFCSAGCTAANASQSNANVVFLSPTGTAAMVGGGESPATPADPTLTTIPATDGINSDLTVWTGTPPTPNPTPTATPTQTPSGSPTATPTATATPTGSATATPTATPTASPTQLPSCSQKR